MNLKFETIVQIFRKIMQLNAVIIWKSANEYYRKFILKSGRKMDLYPAMEEKFWSVQNWPQTFLNIFLRFFPGDASRKETMSSLLMVRMCKQAHHGNRHPEVA